MRNIRIKKLDQLLLGHFVRHLVLLFVLVLFILVIQQFFIYLKEITGKGLSIFIYVQLLSYFGLGMLPSVFPIAVLVAALLSFGSFAETGQLTAMRACGLSLQRILKWPALFMVALSGGVLYFAHAIHPTIMPKVFDLLQSICEKKS